MKRDLQMSVGDGSAYGVMIGVGETYLQAFVLAIGMGEVFAALICHGSATDWKSAATRIPDGGSAPLRSHKWWVVVCAGLQGLS